MTTIIFNTDQIYLHGGIEKVMTTKANFFANRKDVDVVIVTTEQYDHVPCYPLDSKIKRVDLGINYNRSKSYFSLENIKKAFLHYIKQKKLFKMLNPDAIISPNYNFDHYWLPLIKGKARLIKERHSSGFFNEEIRLKASFFQRLKLKFDDWIDSIYTHIVVLNPDEKAYVKSNNTVVIPNPIESSDLKSDMSQKQVVAAGRLSPVKAFDELIEAWSFLADDFPDWQLHIYGQDYLGTQQKLEILIASKNLTKKIILKGSVDDMPKVMTDYSIYAMSSVTECFPMVLLEALSVGLPIVSYDCPNGPRHIVTNNKDGLLADYKNPKNLASKIKSLMENEILRNKMAINAKDNSVRFTTPIVMKNWLTLLHLPND